MEKLCHHVAMKTIDRTRKVRKLQKQDAINNEEELKCPPDPLLTREQPLGHYAKAISAPTTTVARTRLATLAQIGEDWLYLALLGTIMALLSFSMDSVITLFLSTRLWLFEDLSEDNILVQYLGWCLLPIVLVTLSTGFVHLCSPTAIGSGIPEMKTILRGVVLNEYLTFRTLVAKVVGLTFTLGSGLPLGKEGPFVHMASIVATLLSKLVASFQGIYENESRTSEMLSAACAVGVAATFYAPIGGVLFSIEVTTVYFAVRNYWRGFFAACCGATIWRLLGFWIKNDESISALFKTNFRTDYPFDPIELLAFSFIGASSGLAGAGYIKFHREIVQFFRRHKKISGFLQKNHFVYPILVTAIITTVTFPPLIGKYTASKLSTHMTIEHLFSNRTWSLGSQDLVSKKILDHWETPNTSFYLHLFLYITMLFWTSALASTIPIPSGLFIPVLKMGAAYGRLMGELMHSTFPEGISYGDYAHPASIVPGSYAVVGAAAFSGAVTHTISTSVILFEMTGQIVHIIPVILAVLIANAVCQSLQPSIYDSIIEIKKLPYLPPIASSNSVSHKIVVKDFMNTNLAYVWKERCTYADLKSLLAAHRKLISFPLVESPQSMKLLGSVTRPDLLKLLYLHLGRERRLQEVNRRTSDTRSPALHLVNTVSGRLTEERTKRELATRRESIQSTDDRGLEFNFIRSDRSSTASNNSSSNSSFDGDHLSKNGIAKTANGQPIVIRIDTLTSDFGANNALKKRTTSLSCEANTDNVGKEQDVGRRSSMINRDVLSSTSMSTRSVEGPRTAQAVAKLVNKYDQGSTMDEDELDQAIQEVQMQIEVSNETPEQVSTDCSPAEETPPVPFFELTNHKLANDSLTRPKSRGAIKSASRVHNLALQPLGGTPKLGRYLSPLVELKPSSSFNDVAPSPSLSHRPTKSILKTSSTTGSFNNVYNRNMSSQSFASTLGAFDGKQFGSSNQERGAKVSMMLNDGAYFVPGDGCSSVETTPVRQRRKVRLPRLRVVDMTPEEQEQWEQEQLSAHIDISKCQIDEAPFQLVEQTSLYRVHTLFSMLGLNHAYVTSFGRLVGIVALKDMRYAIEKIMQEK